MEVNRILEILDILDKQNFNKVEGTIATEDLYAKIFGSLPKDCTKVRNICYLRCEKYQSKTNCSLAYLFRKAVEFSNSMPQVLWHRDCQLDDFKK